MWTRAARRLDLAWLDIMVATGNILGDPAAIAAEMPTRSREGWFSVLPRGHIAG
jgi:hypothetical protein